MKTTQTQLDKTIAASDALGRALRNMRRVMREGRRAQDVAQAKLDALLGSSSSTAQPPVTLASFMMSPATQRIESDSIYNAPEFTSEANAQATRKL